MQEESKLISVFVQAHLPSLDTDLKNYIAGAIETSFEEDDSIEELCASLEDFLPVEGDASAQFRVGLSQLRHVLQNPQDSLEYWWLPSGEECSNRDLPSDSIEHVVEGEHEEDQSTVNKEWEEVENRTYRVPPTILLSVAKEEGPQAFLELLNIAFPEYTYEQLADVYIDKHNDAEATLRHFITEDDESSHQIEKQIEKEDLYIQLFQHSMDSSSIQDEGNVYQIPVSLMIRTAQEEGPESFLQLLGESFPHYSAEALTTIFIEQESDARATISFLKSLENELAGQATVKFQKSNLSGAAAPDIKSADDFPTLGGDGNAIGGQGVNNSMAGWRDQYAAKAKAASHLPPTGKVSSSQSIGSAPPRKQQPPQNSPPPIWQADARVKMFQTGSALAGEYSQLRSSARDHARMRNMYFQEATKAYVSGNRALAKDLSEKGRWHADQMKMAHQQAADDLFSRRNADGDSTIDLHGLHVAEALEKLEEILNKRGRGEILQVVTGVGQHGKVPARLPGAVKKFLEQKRIKYSEPYAGILEITVR